MARTALLILAVLAPAREAVPSGLSNADVARLAEEESLPRRRATGRPRQGQPHLKPLPPIST